MIGSTFEILLFYMILLINMTNLNYNQASQQLRLLLYRYMMMIIPGIISEYS